MKEYRLKDLRSDKILLFIKGEFNYFKVNFLLE
jgi:hypothetical protein